MFLSQAGRPGEGHSRQPPAPVPPQRGSLQPQLLGVGHPGHGGMEGPWRGGVGFLPPTAPTLPAVSQHCTPRCSLVVPGHRIPPRYSLGGLQEVPHALCQAQWLCQPQGHTPKCLRPGWGGQCQPCPPPPSTGQGSAGSDHSLRSSSPEESGDGFLLRKDSKRRATLHRVLTAEAPGIIAALEESQVGAGCPGWGGSAQQLGGGWAWWQPLSISLTHPEHDGGEVGLGASRPAAELPAELHPVPQPAPAVPGPPGTADPAAGRGAEPPPPPGSPLQFPGSGECPRWSGRVLSG